MVRLATKGRIAKMVLVSGDSDFTPAVEAVKQEGVLTTLWHGGHTARPSRELVEKSDERHELTSSLIQSVLRKP